MVGVDLGILGVVGVGVVGAVVGVVALVGVGAAPWTRGRRSVL